MGKILTITPNYRPHRKQLQLHNAPVGWDEISIVLYGGARGAGKSAGALGDAVLFATTYPGAKIVILRENLDAVKQSFLDKLPSLFPQTVKGPNGESIQLYDYKEKSSSWYPGRSIVFPNGSYITLQRVANLVEAKSKQGWEFNMLVIDEVTKQTEDTVTYLLSTVRSVIKDNPYTGTKIQIPTKVVFGCNPGGIGHKWVKRKFIDTTVTRYDPITNAPIETKDYIYWLGDNGIQTECLNSKEDVKVTVRFIPASYKDNPFLSKSYKAMLQMQNEYTRKMDMDGNWDVVAGKMFDITEDTKIRARDAYKIIEDDKLVRDIYVAIDWGFRPSFHSAQWIAVLEDGHTVTFKEMYGQDLVFEEFVKEIKKRSEGMYITNTLLPHDMFRHGDRHRNEEGKIIGETKAEVFDYFELNPIPIESGKGTVDMRYDKLHSSFVAQDNHGDQLHRISEGCENLWEELDAAVYDEVQVGKIAHACREHAIDAYGLFLVFYSSDIAPMGVEIQDADTRSRVQRMIDDEYESLSETGYVDSDMEYDL